MTPTRPPGTSGLAERLSPEIIAFAIIVVLAIGGVFLVSGESSAGVDQTPSPPAGATASASARAVADPTPPPPTPIPTPPPTPAPTASPTLPLTARPWVTTARTLLVADERLIGWRQAISAELARDPARATELARLIRSTNAAIRVAIGWLEELASSAPSPLITELTAAHQAALDAGVRTLSGTFQDAPAYRRGAARLVRPLAELEFQMKALAQDAGLEDPLPAIEVTPTPTATAAPS